MTASNTSIGAKDGNAAPVSIAAATESVSGLKAGATYLKEPAGETIIDPRSSAANTTGGCSTYCAQGGSGNALLTNTVVAIKAGAGNLYSFDVDNISGVADVYLQLFDLATGSVVLGTTPAKLTYRIPAGGALDKLLDGEAKASFVTAISGAVTSTRTGAGAPAAAVAANFFVK